MLGGCSNGRDGKDEKGSRVEERRGEEVESVDQSQRPVRLRRPPDHCGEWILYSIPWIFFFFGGEWIVYSIQWIIKLLQSLEDKQRARALRGHCDFVTLK